MPPESPLALAVDPDALRSLIAETVRQVLAQIAEDSGRLPADRLAYSEAEAARLLDLHVHQLRDARRRGEITASAIVGGRIRYTRRDLENYLQAHRVGRQPARQRKRA